MKVITHACLVARHVACTCVSTVYSPPPRFTCPAESYVIYIEALTCAKPFVISAIEHYPHSDATCSFYYHYCAVSHSHYISKQTYCNANRQQAKLSDWVYSTSKYLCSINKQIIGWLQVFKCCTTIFSAAEVLSSAAFDGLGCFFYISVRRTSHKWRKLKKNKWLLFFSFFKLNNKPSSSPYPPYLLFS